MNDFKMNLQLFGAETNVITTAQMAKAREVDFVERFSHTSLMKLNEVLGVTRRIPREDGTTLYVYKTTGTLNETNVAEGDIIPLSQYKRTREAVGEMTLKKYRKATTAEAIAKSGYNEAVRLTDEKLLRDIQSGIRTSFFTFLNGVVVEGKAASGTEGTEGYTPAVEAVGTTVTGATLQEVLAKSWGNLQVLFEDDAVELVHFMNPLTIADYLGTANITTQTAFGLNYIENFLGLGTVILAAGITENKVYSTAKENLIMYYENMNSSEVASAFNLTSDETGFVGMHTSQTDNRAQIETLVMTGVEFLVEYADGVVAGTVTGA
jgi:hypothetical protein